MAESGLLIARYATDVLGISGGLNSSGAVTAQGGVLPGSFTTTQRNAILNPPNGLIIFNSTTNQLEMNFGTSGSPNWQGVGPKSYTIAYYQEVTSTIPISDNPTDAIVMTTDVDCTGKDVIVEFSGFLAANEPAGNIAASLLESSNSGSTWTNIARMLDAGLNGQTNVGTRRLRRQSLTGNRRWKIILGGTNSLGVLGADNGSDLGPASLTIWTK